jgi:hypothetical protein
MIVTTLTEMQMAGQGLGSAINAASRFADPRVFAGIVEIAVTGPCLVKGATAPSRRLLIWHQEGQEPTTVSALLAGGSRTCGHLRLRGVWRGFNRTASARLATLTLLSPLARAAGLSAENFAAGFTYIVLIKNNLTPSCADLIRASTSLTRPLRAVGGRVKPGQDEIGEAISFFSSPQDLPRTVPARAGSRFSRIPPYARSPPNFDHEPRR